MDYVIKNLEDDLLAGFDVTDYSSSRDFYKGLIDNLLEFLGSNKIFFRSILNNNYNSGIITVFHDSAIKHILELIEKEGSNNRKNRVPPVVVSEFYAGAVTSTILWWLKTNSNISEKDL